MALLTELVRTAPLVHPGIGWRDRLSQLKYCVRGLAYAGQTQELFSALQSPKLALAAETHPRILSKLQRPYLHRKLGHRQRLEALQYHYDFVAQNFPEAMLGGIFSRRGFLVAAFALEGVGRFGLRLVYRDDFEKEGELCLVLCDEVSIAMLFTLTFCVVAGELGIAEIFIGGLQGCKAVNERERVVAVTRAMHGLRPKALLIFAMQQLALIWAIPAIRAVGNANHIYRHYRKRRSFAASYDEFWNECGGGPARDGNFILPASPNLRPIAEIKPGKRAMYRRRYAMLENLAKDIRNCLLPEDTAQTRLTIGSAPTRLSPLAVATARVPEWYI